MWPFGWHRFFRNRGDVAREIMTGSDGMFSIIWEKSSIGHWHVLRRPKRKKRNEREELKGQIIFSPLDLRISCYYQKCVSSH